MVDCPDVTHFKQLTKGETRVKVQLGGGTKTLPQFILRQRVISHDSSGTEITVINVCISKM